MPLKKFFLFFIVAVTTIYGAQAKQFLNFRNQSSLTIQVTVPKHEVETAADLEHTPTQKIVIPPARNIFETTRLEIPAAVQTIWLSIPSQPHRSYENINLKEICIMLDPTLVYDLYITLETHFINWFAALFCYGVLDMHKIAELQSTGYSAARSYEEGYHRMGFPIYSKKPSVALVDVQQEVVALLSMFNTTYTNFLRTHMHPYTA